MSWTEWVLVLFLSLGAGDGVPASSIVTPVVLYPNKAACESAMPSALEAERAKWPDPKRLAVFCLAVRRP